MLLGVTIIKRIFEKLKKDISSIICIIIGLLLYPLVHHLAGSCPIRQIFGISCPGCGILRAYLAVFDLNFAEAFKWHPLWFTVPIILLLVAVFYLTDKAKALNTTIIISVVLFCTIYFLRLIFGDGSVVYIRPSESKIFEFINWLFS